MRVSASTRTFVALVCVLTASACALLRVAPELPTAPADGSLPGDYSKLQGVWTVVYDEQKRKPRHERAGALFIFEGNRFRLGTDKGHEWYAIDDASLPKRIDFYDGRSLLIRGIYTLEGDTLTLCTGDPGEPRPTAFETSRLSGAILTKLVKRDGA